MFGNGKAICLACEREYEKEIVKYIYKGAGICEKCFENMRKVPADSPFEGTEYVNCVLSAYYYDEILKKLVHKYKFKREWLFADIFSDMVYEYIKDIAYVKTFDFMTSIPLSKRRFLDRGFNQSELIAKRLCEKLEIPYVNCVYRCKNTKAQSKLKKEKRVINIKDAFVADREKVENKNILLFDDVFTTGSTANSCAKELCERGAKSVTMISLAIVRY